MMASDYIIHVSEADFEYQVIAYSQKIPVVVDFWAEWCVPCRTLGPILERLTLEAQGAFRLAKLDVDQNQNLAMRFNVRSIPSVKAFRDGKIISEFTGLQPEPQIREFVRSIAPSPTDLELEKGVSLYQQNQYHSAETAFRQVLNKKPGNPGAQLGLVKSLIMQDHIIDAHNLLKTFPESAELPIAEKLLDITNALTRLDYGESNSLNALEAAYARALRLVKMGNLPAALDGMLDILREEKTFRDGELRKVYLGILELMGVQNPDVRQYRQELASVLF